jgi:formylglycine-generating enzyme required for sulfatase activity
MMVRRSIILLLLVLLVLVGCGDEFTEDEEKALKDLVKDKVVADASEKEIIWKKDGKEMVLIPAGSFEMGDHFDEGRDDELPVHTVELDAFYMDVHEVTVGQFREFVDESGHKYSRWNDVATYSPTDEHPMILVTWNDATAYAEWVGKRLPTEAEWEYAARGGLIGKRYPWGDEISHDDANYSGTGGKDEWKYCAPVGSFEPNGYGLYDMAGNVWEFCEDWYSEDKEYRVLRGGSWFNIPNYLRAALRFFNNPSDTLNLLGFRCVSGF